MPSCAAPHVIVWWRSSVAVALFIISVGGQTGSYCCGVSPTQTRTGVCPGDGWASMEIAAAAVGLPAPGEHDVDVRAVGRDTAPALTDPTVQLVEVHAALPPEQ